MNHDPSKQIADRTAKRMPEVPRHNYLRITWVTTICFGLLCYAWLAIAWYYSTEISNGILWIALLGSGLLGAPIFLAGLYGATIRNIHRSAALQTDGWVRKWFERRLLSTLIWLCGALFAGFSALFWLRTLQRYEWYLILGSVPLFLLLFRLINHLVGAQFKPYISIQKSLLFTQCLYAVSMSVAVVGVYFNTIGDNPPFYFSELIKAEQLKPLYYTKSLLIQYAERVSIYYDGAKTFALSNLIRYGNILPIVIVSISSFALFFSVALAFSGFLIPASEYRRVVSALDEADKARPMDTSKSIMLSAVIVIVIGFIYVPSMAKIDYGLKQNPELGKVIEGIEDAALPHFEMIESQLYKPGTIDALQALKIEFLKAYSENRHLLIRLGQQGFEKMLNNVEPYLDWYYSLPAEYLRLGAMLTNSLEDRVAKDLSNRLVKNDPFKALNSQFDQIMNANDDLKKKYTASLEALLMENQVIPDSDRIQVDRVIPLAAVTVPADTIIGIDLKTRFGAAGVGAITGVVAAKVVGKAISKGTVKLAAKAMTKAALTKATSGTIGASIGALIGSIIPGAGTLVGSAIGATLGLAFGVSVDALLLTIDEYLTRDEFRSQIHEAIVASAKEYFDMVSAQP